MNRVCRVAITTCLIGLLTAVLSWTAAHPVLAETKSMLAQITKTFAEPVPVTEVQSDEPFQLAVCMSTSTLDFCSAGAQPEVQVPFVTRDGLQVKWYEIEYASWNCGGTFPTGIVTFRLRTLLNGIEFHTFRVDSIAQKTAIYAGAGTILSLSSDASFACKVVLSGRLVAR